MPPINIQDLIAKNTIPRDANFETTAPLVGIDPATGNFVALKLTSNPDGTYSLNVNASGITVDTLDIGDVVVRGVEADGVTEHRINVTQTPASIPAIWNLDTHDYNLDVALSTRATETTLQAILAALAGGGSTVSITGQVGDLASSALYTTTNLFANAATYTVDHYKSKTFIVQNTGINSIDLRMLASIDGGAAYDVVAVNSISIPAGGSATITDTDYETNVVLQAKSTSSGMPSTVITKLAAVAV